MKINLLLIVLFFASLSSCTDDTKSSNPSSETGVVSSMDEEIPSGEGMVFLRDPVNIIASTGEDYPKTLKELDFPILPNAEVTNVGNTDIANGTVVMQMETETSKEQVIAFYKKALPGKNWKEKETKVYKGADGALTFKSDDYTCLLYTSPSPRDRTRSRMPSSA